MIFVKDENGFIIKNQNNDKVGFIDIRSHTFSIGDDVPDAEFTLTEVLQIATFMSTLKEMIR